MPANSTVERVRDWQWVTAQIAALQPHCEPGKRSFYHAMTYAWILGEVVRRTDPAHRPFERFVHEEIFTPLGIDSFYFTVTPALSSRVAKLSGAGYPNPPEGSPMRIGMPAALDLTPEIFNRAETQRTLIPAVGAYANAHSAARLFALLANAGSLDGVRLFAPQRVRTFSELRANSEESDPYLGHAARLSAGFWLGGDKPAVGSRANIIYSIGAGGSLAWADVNHRLSVAIAHNKMYGRQPIDVDPAIAIGRRIRSSLDIPE